MRDARMTRQASRMYRKWYSLLREGIPVFCPMEMISARIKTGTRNACESRNTAEKMPEVISESRNRQLQNPNAKKRRSSSGSERITPKNRYPDRNSMSRNVELAINDERGSAEEDRCFATGSIRVVLSVSGRQIPKKKPVKIAARERNVIPINGFLVSADSMVSISDCIADCTE